MTHNPKITHASDVPMVLRFDPADLEDLNEGRLCDHYVVVEFGCWKRCGHMAAVAIQCIREKEHPGHEHRIDGGDWWLA